MTEPKPSTQYFTVLGPNGFREVPIDTGTPGAVIHLEEGEKIISRDPVPEDGVPRWNRADISAAHFMRVQSIALNLANIVYAEHKDPLIRAEIAELRRILNAKVDR